MRMGRLPVALVLCAAAPLSWAARVGEAAPPTSTSGASAAAAPGASPIAVPLASPSPTKTVTQTITQTTSAPTSSTPAAKSVRSDRVTTKNVSRQWRSPRFVYKAEGKRVNEVLLDFAASQGLPAVLADGIDGMVQANFDTTPDKFLDSMNRAYGVIWYHDGTALYFYPAGAVQSRLFRLKGFRREQVTDLLDSLQLGDARFPLRFNAAESTLLVYGPPRHVELIAAAVESLDVGAMERNRKAVRVVPLRFASAGDRTFGQTRIRGVASVLTSLYSGGTSGGGSGAQGDEDTPSMAEVHPGKLTALQGVMGRDSRLADIMARKPNQVTAGQSAKSGAGAASQGSARGLQSPVDDDAPPMFQADEGTNTVIIHGRPQRMDEYVELIRRLDVQPVLVELEATIIDVSSDSIDSLGIDWSVRGSKGSFGVTQPSTANNAGTFTLSTLWSNAGRELMARIDALSARGKARVIAKPKVLGVANRPAVMREKRVVTVKVAGNLEANLFQVEAGTLLQVTPQITSVPDNGGVAPHQAVALHRGRQLRGPARRQRAHRQAHRDHDRGPRGRGREPAHRRHHHDQPGLAARRGARAGPRAAARRAVPPHQREQRADRAPVPDLAADHPRADLPVGAVRRRDDRRHGDDGGRSRAAIAVGIGSAGAGAVAIPVERSVVDVPRAVVGARFLPAGRQRRLSRDAPPIHHEATRSSGFANHEAASHPHRLACRGPATVDPSAVPHRQR